MVQRDPQPHRDAPELIFVEGHAGETVVKISLGMRHWLIPFVLGIFGTCAVAAFGYWVLGVSPSAIPSANWELLALTTGAVSLGFGAGALLYRRIIGTQWRELSEQYRSLQVRSQALVEAFDRFQGQKAARGRQ